MKKLVIAALFAPSVVLAGLYDQPYSIIQTDASRSSDHLIRPVLVNRVDDVNAQYDNRDAQDLSSGERHRDAFGSWISGIRRRKLRF